MHRQCPSLHQARNGLHISRESRLRSLGCLPTGWLELRRLRGLMSVLSQSCSMASGCPKKDPQPEGCPQEIVYKQFLWALMRLRPGVSLDSIIYRYHNPEASLEEGLETLKRCLDEVSKRLVVSPGKYKVKVVDKDGVREVEI